MINQLIKNTLAPLGIPVTNLKYSGSATTYITFFSYNEHGEEWAEDKEIATGFYIQVDVWSKGDCTDIAAQAKTLLENAGFRRTYATEMYENDTLTFHKVLKVTYVVNT